MPLAVRPSRHPPTEEEWESIRLTVKDLLQQKKLEEIVTQLRDDGYLVTQKTLKGRLKKWKLGKNLTNAGALAIIQKNKQREAEGKESEFFYRGKPVKVEEAVRHLRRKGISEEDAVNMIETRANTPSDLTIRTPKTTPLSLPDDWDNCGIPFSDSGTSDDNDTDWTLMLHTRRDGVNSKIHFLPQVVPDSLEARIQKNIVESAQAYYTSMLSSNSWVLATVDYDMKELYPSMEFGGLFNRFVNLRTARKFERSFKCLNTAFDMIKPLLKTQDPRLITYLFESIAYLKTLGHVELANSLIQNFSQMSYIVLGRSHPITILTACLYLSDEQLQPRLVEAGLDRIKSNLRTHLGPLHVETMRFLLTASTILKHQKSFDASLRYLEELQTPYELVYGVNSYEACHALVDNGHLCRLLRKYDEAEAVIGESLRRAHEITDEYDHIQSVVRCTNALAVLEGDRGNMALKRSYLKTSLSTAEGKLEPFHWMVLEAQAIMKEDEDFTEDG